MSLARTLGDIIKSIIGSAARFERGVLPEHRVRQTSWSLRAPKTCVVAVVKGVFALVFVRALGAHAKFFDFQSASSSVVHVRPESFSHKGATALAALDLGFARANWSWWSQVGLLGGSTRFETNFASRSLS